METQLEELMRLIVYQQRQLRERRFARVVRLEIAAGAGLHPHLQQLIRRLGS